WCDLRVAGESAVFGCFERRWGVPLVDGGTQRLPRVVGLGRALEMILLGRAVGAREALGFGLVNAVVPDERAVPTALEWAELIAGFPQEPMLADREAALRGFGTGRPASSSAASASAPRPSTASSRAGSSSRSSRRGSAGWRRRPHASGRASGGRRGGGRGAPRRRCSPPSARSVRRRPRGGRRPSRRSTRIARTHRWDLSVEDAIALQHELAATVD